MQISRNNIIFWGSLITLILVSYWWRLQVLNTFPLLYDEGIHLILGKLWAAGYSPYQEIFVSYPPSFIWSLGVPWKMFNQASALQVVMITYALAGILAVVYLGSVYNSRLAGLVAGAFLSFTPAYFIPSFSIMTEVPSISMAVAAIALAEKYRRHGAWGWAFLSGLILGIGLSLKILPIYAVPMVGLLVIIRHVEHTTSNSLKALQMPKLWRNIAILSGGFVVTFVLPIFLFDLPSFYEQVVGMRLVSREVEFNPLESNNDYIRDFLFSHPGLTALALYGLVFVVVRKLNRYWLLVVWFILVWISVYFLTPLRPKHLPIFLPILAIFAGFAVQHMVHFLKSTSKQNVSLRSVAMLLTITIVLVMFGWRIPSVIAENNGQNLNVKENKERLKAIHFIDTIARPNDCVIADNPVFLYQTNRLPPPELAETSQTRIDTGHLTLQDVIQVVQKYECHVVAVVTPRFGKSIPGLPEWLGDNYLGLYAQDETFVYFALKGSHVKVMDNFYTSIQHGNFEHLIQIDGIQIHQQFELKPEEVFISLVWQLEAPIDNQIIEQVIELRQPDTQQPVYQVKRLPFGGYFNPTNWPINEAVRDTFRVNLPDQLTKRTYELYLSLCQAESGQCLVLDGTTQTELYLGQITMQP